MVVDDDDGRAVAPDGVPEYLTDPDVRGVEAAHIDRLYTDQPVSRVEVQHPKVFLLQMRHLGHQELCHVGRGAHDKAVFGCGQQHAAAQFQRRLELGRLGLPQSLFGLQLCKAGPGQPGQTSVPGQQPGGQRQDVLAAHAGTQDDGQQLGRRQRTLPSAQQPLAGALVDRQLLDGGSVFGGSLFFRHATTIHQVVGGCQMGDWAVTRSPTAQALDRLC
jgi:hypothetical protein